VAKRTSRRLDELSCVAAQRFTTSPPVMVRVTPDRRSRLSEGGVVEASVRARLLGIRLLTLDASVVIAPAEVAVPWARSNDPSHRSPARSSSLPPARSGAIGGGLAEAVRSVHESAALLAEARNGWRDRRTATRLPPAAGDVLTSEASSIARQTGSSE
jgi:hypothetical protein